MLLLLKFQKDVNTGVIRMGPRNHVLDGGSHLPWEGAILRRGGGSGGSL